MPDFFFKTNHCREGKLKIFQNNLINNFWAITEFLRKSIERNFRHDLGAMHKLRYALGGFCIM